MGKFKKWIEWIAAGIAFLIGIATFGMWQRRKGAALGEEIQRAKDDHAAVQRERERTKGESAADLFKDLTQ